MLETWLTPLRLLGEFPRAVVEMAAPMYHQSIKVWLFKDIRIPDPKYRETLVVNSISLFYAFTWPHWL